MERSIRTCLWLVGWLGSMSICFAAKLGPPDKAEALLAQPDSSYTFIVTSTESALDAVHGSLGVAGATGLKRIAFLHAIVATMKVSALLELGADPRIVQIWYLNPDIVDVYVGLLQSLSYAYQTMPPPGVLNISAGPPADVMPIKPYVDEPMNQATRVVAEKGLIPVIAIGNYFDGENYGTVSPWCRPDWVICVGAATKTADGPWAGSARGASEDPASWPDVVAVGQDVVSAWPSNLEKSRFRQLRDESSELFLTQVPPDRKNEFTLESGTSFAVPYVSKAAAHIIHFVTELRRSRKGIEPGDALFALEIPRDRFEATKSAGPRLTGDVRVLSESTVEVSYRLVEPWKLVKQLIIDTALPMPQSSPRDVGAGLVSVENVEAQFDRFGRSRTKVMPIGTTP